MTNYLKIIFQLVENKFPTHICLILSVSLFSCCSHNRYSSSITKELKNTTLLLDMVHHNPSEPLTKTVFNNPDTLTVYGFKGKIFFLFEAAPFALDWKSYNDSIFKDGSKELDWIYQKKVELTKKYNEAKKAGLSVYCQMDMLVLPKGLITQDPKGYLNDSGKIDLSKPKTTMAIRFMINQVFDEFPQLDGLVIRTGETYLHDAPHYIGNNPVINDIEDHIGFIDLLRHLICIKNNKRLIYRTWDFGKFHSLPKYYEQITDKIEPHENLIFSIKHTQTDFWRGSPEFQSSNLDSLNVYWLTESSNLGVPFNPALGRGKHPQLVEVQCQREYEGKGSHPIYIAKEVLEGFIGHENTNGFKGLLDFYKHPNYKGVWTWSRGGGWGGPYITNELWPAINTYVIAQWTKNPLRAEEDIFYEFATKAGISKESLQDFRKLALLSSSAIYKGEYSQYGGLFVNWLRDDTFGGIGELKSIDTNHLTISENFEKYIDEKKEAVQLWKEIVDLSTGIKCKNSVTEEFIRVSSEYGLCKYKVARFGFEIILIGLKGERTGVYDLRRLKTALLEYDQAWHDWEKLYDTNSGICPTIYKRNYGIDQQTGLDLTIKEYRKLIVSID